MNACAVETKLNEYYRKIVSSNIVITLDVDSLFEDDKLEIAHYKSRYNFLLRIKKPLRVTVPKIKLYKMLNKYPNLLFKLKLIISECDKDIATRCSEIVIIDGRFLELASGVDNRLSLDDFDYSDFVFDLTCLVLDYYSERYRGI